MKKAKKILMVALILTIMLTLVSCSDSNQPTTKTPQIGIVQIAPHPSLDNCYQGFLAGLAEAGYQDGQNIKINYQNAQGEMANSDMIAKNMVSAKYDLILGIATPSAMSVYSAAKDTSIPVVFSAVSDPVAPGL